MPHGVTNAKKVILNQRTSSAWSKCHYEGIGEKGAVLQVTFSALKNKLLMEKVSHLQCITGPRSPGKPLGLTGYP